MTSNFVHLGKHGDIIILLSGWKRMFDETGVRPTVMVAKEFAATLEGASYVEPWIVNLHWYGDCDKACDLADKTWGRVNYIFPKWWDNPRFTPPAIRNDATTLIIHGNRMQIEKDDWFSYMASQWKYAGFKMENILDRPVFDQRHLQREEYQFKYFTKTDKPKLLICLGTGGSSPFPFVPEVERVVYKFRDKFEIVDLNNVRLERIYDMVGFFDRSAFLITTDTATLHVAGASSIPYFAFIANGGGGSIPRGQCVAQSRYETTMSNLQLLEKHIINSYEKSARLHPHQANTQHPAPPHLPHRVEHAPSSKPIFGH